MIPAQPSLRKLPRKMSGRWWRFTWMARRSRRRSCARKSRADRRLSPAPLLRRKRNSWSAGLIPEPCRCQSHFYPSKQSGQPWAGARSPPGLVAVVSLCIFIAIMLSLFKLIPVTLTAAGIAGFIISMGIAVDANVLIFERVKEELRSGKTIADALPAGFSRAWLAIRDSNISSILASIILFWFGTSLIKGFALTLGMGVLVSMFSAITITRIFLSAINFLGEGKAARFLFLSGLSK